MKWLILAALGVGGYLWWTQQQTGSSATSQTPGQPSAGALPLSSGSAVIPAGGAPQQPGVLDRFIGPGAVPAPRQIAPQMGVVAQLQKDTTQQRLQRFYGGYWPTRSAVS